MGNIDDAVPFFGKGFNKIYPLIMVIYTILIASNFFDRIMNYLGNYKIFRFQSEESDDLDGYDPSGLIILQKERSWLQEGHKVGELVVPLARSFSNATIDLLESGSNNTISYSTQASPFTGKDGHQSHTESLKSVLKNDASADGMNKKYAAIRSHPIEQEMKLTAKEKVTHTTASYDAENAMMQAKPSSGIASTWESMKTGFCNFKSNIEVKKFIPLSQLQETRHSCVSSSESLDDIFVRIRHPTADHTNYGSDDDLDSYAMGIKGPRSK